MERLIGVLAVLILAFLFSFVLRRVLFKRGSRGKTPSAEKVRAHLGSLSQESLERLRNLRIEYQTELSLEAFSTLCVATALSTEQPISALGAKLVLLKYFDSLSSICYILLLEDLFSISMPDEIAEKILTFRQVVDYVGSAVSK